MADMDLDDLLEKPAQAPPRPSKFAPKGSKFKPKPKAEPSESAPPSASGKGESLPPPKKEEIGVEASAKPEHASDAVDMDVDVKPESVVKEEETIMEPETEPAEDEVVREIDVFFSPSFDPNARLYVLQYVLRPSWRPYDLDGKCKEVRVKPASSEVEIDLVVDVDSKNYDSGADPRVQMQKQTISTKWIPPPKSGYAIGVLAGNKLHLNPIHAVVQLRPNMNYLDSEASKRKTHAASNAENVVKSEEHQEPPGSSKKLSKVPEKSEDIGEGWVPLKYHGMGSDIATGYQQKMMAREGSHICFSMTSNEYLTSLCGTSNDNSSKVPSRRNLRTLPLKERLKTCLLEGPPFQRFDALKYVVLDESDEEVLGVLQEYGRLVQGLWVPKSSLLYEKDFGIEVLARDFVLLLFSKNNVVKSSQLPQRHQLNKAMKDVLNKLAVERPDLSDWKLKESPDRCFIKQNPSIVKKQDEEWECLQKKINDIVGARIGPAIKTSSKASPSNLPNVGSSNKEATRTPNVATSRNAMSAEVRDAITKALQKLFKSVKVCSYQQISQRLRDMAVSESARSTGFAREAVAAANSIDASPDELRAIVSRVAVDIHGLCVPKSSPDHPQYDPFRKIVIDFFLANGPNAKLTKSHVLQAAKIELKRDIPLTEYQKVLQELCKSQGSAWVLRSGDGSPNH